MSVTDAHVDPAALYVLIVEVLTSLSHLDRATASAKLIILRRSHQDSLLAAAGGDRQRTGTGSVSSGVANRSRRIAARRSVFPELGGNFALQGQCLEDIIELIETDAVFEELFCVGVGCSPALALEALADAIAPYMCATELPDSAYMRFWTAVALGNGARRHIQHSLSAGPRCQHWPLVAASISRDLSFAAAFASANNPMESGEGESIDAQWSILTGPLKIVFLFQGAEKWLCAVADCFDPCGGRRIDVVVQEVIKGLFSQTLSLECGRQFVLRCLSRLQDRKAEATSAAAMAVVVSRDRLQLFGLAITLSGLECPEDNCAGSRCAIGGASDEGSQQFLLECMRLTTSLPDLMLLVTATQNSDSNRKAFSECLLRSLKLAVVSQTERDSLVSASACLKLLGRALLTDETFAGNMPESSSGFPIWIVQHIPNSQLARQLASQIEMGLEDPVSPLASKSIEFLTEMCGALGRNSTDLTGDLMTH
jgi:hypothetical protein